MVCVVIPQIDGNVSYCNITSTWQPRVTSSIIVIVPTIMAAALLLLTLIWRRSKKIDFWDGRYAFSISHFKGMFRSYTGFMSGLTMMGIYMGLAWDIVDVSLDSKYFLDLENPSNGVLDSRIYRNSHALNAIYCFSLLGVVKVPFSVWIITSEMSAKVNDRPLLTSANAALVFLSEDCVENLVEYFYGEKYSMDGQYASYTIAMSVIITCLYLAKLPLVLKCFRQIESDESAPEKLIVSLGMLMPICIVLAGIMRIYGALYQAITGKLDIGCVKVDNGRLIQTPFTSGGQCMRTFEYFFIVFNFLPIVFTFVVFLTMRILQAQTNRKVREYLHGRANIEEDICT